MRHLFSGCIKKLFFCCNEAVAKNLMGFKVKARRTDAAHVYCLALECNPEINLAARPGKNLSTFMFVTTEDTLLGLLGLAVMRRELPRKDPSPSI